MAVLQDQFSNDDTKYLPLKRFLYNVYIKYFLSSVTIHLNFGVLNARFAQNVTWPTK